MSNNVGRKLMAAPNPSPKVSFFKRLKKWISTSSYADSVEKIKDDSFGHSFFIQPVTPNFKHYILCMANDETKLAHKIKLKSLDFRESRGVQSRGALYVFFWGALVTVK